jgi:uncharacterized membrane protein YozB (DUF420 family)
MSLLPLSALPTLNAGLNATCALLLVAGYLCIRRRRILSARGGKMGNCCVNVFFDSVLFQVKKQADFGCG